MSNAIAVGRAAGSSANRATRSGFTSWATSGRSRAARRGDGGGPRRPGLRPRPSARPARRRRAPGRSRRAAAGRRGRAPRRRPAGRRATARARRSPSPPTSSIRPPGSAIAAASARRQVARPARPGPRGRARRLVGPGPLGRRRRRRRLTAAPSMAPKSSDSWRPVPSPTSEPPPARDPPRAPPAGAGPQPVGRPATWAARIGSSRVGRPERLDRLLGPLAAERRQPLDERPELVLAEQPDDLLAVVVAEPGGLEVELDRQVAHDRHQLAALEDPVARLGQGQPELLGRHLVDPLEDALEAAERLDELRRGLLAHAGDARDVVGRVALERLEVDHLGRLEAVPLLDPGRVVDDRVLDARPGRHQAGPVGHELEHVEVAGDDRRVEPVALGLDGQRADDVVGLVAGQLVDRDPERLDDLADLRELVAQVVRHPLPGRLVVGELLVAEGRPGQVEGDRDVVRPDVLEAAQDDAAEAEDRVDELALRRRQGREREVSAVDEPVAVEQHQAFHRRASAAVGVDPLSVPGEHPPVEAVRRSASAEPASDRPQDARGRGRRRAGRPRRRRAATARRASRTRGSASDRRPAGADPAGRRRGRTPGRWPVGPPPFVTAAARVGACSAARRRPPDRRAGAGRGADAVGRRRRRGCGWRAAPARAQAPDAGGLRGVRAARVRLRPRSRQRGSGRGSGIERGRPAEAGRAARRAAGRRSRASPARPRAAG